MASLALQMRPLHALGQLAVGLRPRYAARLRDEVHVHEARDVLGAESGHCFTTSSFRGCSAPQPEQYLVAPASIERVTVKL